MQPLEEDLAHPHALGPLSSTPASLKPKAPPRSRPSVSFPLTRYPIHPSPSSAPGPYLAPSQGAAAAAVTLPFLTPIPVLPHLSRASWLQDPIGRYPIHPIPASLVYHIFHAPRASQVYRHPGYPSACPAPDIYSIFRATPALGSLWTPSSANLWPRAPRRPRLAQGLAYRNSCLAVAFRRPAEEAEAALSRGEGSQRKRQRPSSPTTEPSRRHSRPVGRGPETWGWRV